MKTSNFTFKFLLVSFFSLQAFFLLGQISAFNTLSPFGGGTFLPATETIYEEVYLYVPDNNNTLTIREKSDFKFSFDRKLKSKSLDGISRYAPLEVNVDNFRIGYSPIPNLYGTASWLMVSEREGTNSYDSKMTQGDIGIGVYHLKEFKNIIKKENILNKTTAGMMQKKGLLVNALLGYSRGVIHHELSWTPGLAKFRLNKFYGQVGFDYQARLWGVAGTAKVGVINYGLTYLEGRATSELELPKHLLTKKNNFGFSELSIRFYVGMKFGQIYLKGMKSTTNKRLNDYVISDYWSVGAVLNIQEFL